MSDLHRLSPARESPIDDHPELILTDGDPHLSYGIWMIMGGALIYLVLLLAASSPDYLGRIYGVIALIGLAVVAQALLRFRGAVAAIRFLAIGGWTFATYAGFAGEGVRAPILVAYPTILIFSGWMLGLRFCVGLLVASCVAVGAMVAAQGAGLIGQLRAVTPPLVGVVHVFVLSISTILTIYLLRTFRRRYAEEHRLNAEIGAHLRTLEKRDGYQRALLDNFPFMVWLKDENGRYLAVNQAFVSGFGWPSATVVGKTDLDIAAAKPPGSAEGKDEITLFSGGSAKPVEELVEMRGTWRWCETSRSPVTVNGKVVGMVGYARDISWQRQLMEELESYRNQRGAPPMADAATEAPPRPPPPWSEA
ncbi:MAG: PAS domain S-box protein [Rhodocyclales bacterium]|nr:PAS domain S-box protein [Rhodocyclales bacterium]